MRLITLSVGQNCEWSVSEWKPRLCWWLNWTWSWSLINTICRKFVKSLLNKYKLYLNFFPYIQSFIQHIQMLISWRACHKHTHTQICSCVCPNNNYIYKFFFSIQFKLMQNYRIHITLSVSQVEGLQTDILLSQDDVRLDLCHKREAL